MAQHSPLMSPLVWDLAHVGHYEELWLLRAVARTQPMNPLHDDIYDAFRHARRDRSRLAMLGPSEARAHIAVVRGRVLDVLERVEFDPATPLLSEGFVYRMVAQHEHQHDETMLATLQLMGRPYPHDATPVPAGRTLPAGEVLIPGGSFVMGTSSDLWAYDNERPAHPVEVGPFWIDTVPVTNQAYTEFIAAGGYDEPRWWSEAGWKWRQEAGLVAPEFWRSEGDGSFSVLRYGERLPVPRFEPVQHVCFYEAEAYAAWAGKRLPTEAEWEKAASWAPDGRKRRLPWGDGSRETLSCPGDTPEPPGAAGQPGPAPLRARPRGGLSHRRQRLGRRAPAGRRVGVDGVRFPSLSRLQFLPLQGVLRSVLWLRLQGPAGRLVGDPPPRRADDVPQLGLPHPPSDLRRLPVRP